MKQSKAMTYLMRTVGRPVMKKYYERAIFKAKLEVFSDVEDWLGDGGENDWRAWDSDYLDQYDAMKERHLLTSLEKKKRKTIKWF